MTTRRSEAILGISEKSAGPEGVVADERTQWPEDFDLEAAEVTFEPLGRHPNPVNRAWRQPRSDRI